MSIITREAGWGKYGIVAVFDEAGMSDEQIMETPGAKLGDAEIDTDRIIRRWSALVSEGIASPLYLELAGSAFKALADKARGK